MQQLKRGDIVTLTGDYEHSLASLSPWLVLDRWMNSGQMVCYNIYRPQVSIFAQKNLRKSGKHVQLQMMLRQAYNSLQEKQGNCTVY